VTTKRIKDADQAVVLYRSGNTWGWADGQLEDDGFISPEAALDDYLGNEPDEHEHHVPVSDAAIEMRYKRKDLPS